MKLTEAQIDEMQEGLVADMTVGDPFCCDTDVADELLRGYRAMLNEVEYHQTSIEQLKVLGADGGPAEAHHIDRLHALQSEEGV